jgi:hypothetical protein
MPQQEQPPIGNLLTDFYSKYAPDQTLTPDRLQAIQGKYGQDHERLVRDLYAKYAPDQELPEERMSAIFNRYGLKKKDQALPLGVSGPQLPTVAPPPGASGSEQITETAPITATVPSELEQALSGPTTPEEPIGFGSKTIEQIEDQLREEMAAPPVVSMDQPITAQVPAAFDRPIPQRKLTQRELDANQFEVTKSHLKDLIQQADKALYAENLQKYSKTLIPKIDEQMASIEADAKKRGVYLGPPITVEGTAGGVPVM